MKSTGLLCCGALLLACGSDPQTVGSGDLETRKPDAGGRADGGKRDASSSTSPGGKKDAGKGGSSGGGGDGCETQNIAARENPPDILIVLDRSLSMEFGGRWQPSTSAVKMLTNEFENQVQFGLMTFPSGNSVCDPGKLDVPVAPVNASAVNGFIDGTGPTGFTPTAGTLKNALEALGDRNIVADAVPIPAYVLLVTDGEPQCPGEPDQSPRAVEAVTALAQAGIKTYVIGYNLALGADLMNQMAQAGGTDRYYEVANQQELSDAFAEVTKDIVKCEFELSEVPMDPTFVRVTIDGETVTLNAADGWVIDGKKITLQSGSCDLLKDGQSHTLQVKVECTQVFL
ncbi:MAG TPA: vWA domain-containing protein [Polyangiales bacterium]|nr:vWA domain-containing protein [Polyangiales bacterium]